MFELIPPHEDIGKLLKRCAALEDLVITRTRDDNVRLYNINNVPTLKSLTINKTQARNAPTTTRRFMGFG